VFAATIGGLFNMLGRDRTIAVFPDRAARSGWRRWTSHSRLRTGGEGTYVLGLSVKPREISLTGEQFNRYIKEEGMDDILAERMRTGALGKPVRERYTKQARQSGWTHSGGTSQKTWARPGSNRPRRDQETGV